MKIYIYIFFALTLAACNKEPYIAEGNYINPPKDSVSFGYRLTDIYFNDANLNETHFKFKLDTSIGYTWREVLIEYEETGISKQYIPEYVNYRVSKLVDISPAAEDITITYTQVGLSKKYLISNIKYKRKKNPIAIQFVYNSDTGFVYQILKRELTIGGDLGVIQDQYDFCLAPNLGSCTPNESYQYSGDFNSLRYCNELLPFMLLLSKPDFQDLEDISSILPYYFSQNLPQSSILYNKGTYQYGLNKKEPTFLYFKPLNSLRSEGFQFSMRIY